MTGYSPLCRALPYAHAVVVDDLRPNAERELSLA